MTKIALVAVFALALAGCAGGARTTEMTVIPSTQVAATSPLHQSIKVGTVSGGSATNPMWKSNIGNPEFQGALEASLTAEGMLATDAGHYRLDVSLDQVDQPLMGFDMTVTATAHYTLVDTATGKPAFDKIVTEPFTATVSDAFMGVERLRMANEGAIKKNIATFMDQLIAEFGKPMVSEIEIASPKS